MSIKHKKGDIFSIAMADGKFAICKVISAFTGEFRKAFSFCILSIQKDESIPMEDRCISFINSRGRSKIIFTSPAKIKNGEWKILSNKALTDEQKELEIFQCAGHLYHDDEYVRCLSKDEYKTYEVMGLAGFELVDKYLQQLIQI